LCDPIIIFLLKILGAEICLGPHKLLVRTTRQTVNLEECMSWVQCSFLLFSRRITPNRIRFCHVISDFLQATARGVFLKEWAYIHLTDNVIYFTKWYHPRVKGYTGHQQVTWKLKHVFAPNTRARSYYQPVCFGLFARIWLIIHDLNSVFLSHQTSQQYFQSWLISQTNRASTSEMCRIILFFYWIKRTLKSILEMINPGAMSIGPCIY